MNVLLGSGAPGAGTGVDGDIYINTATYDLYGPKAAGAWGAIAIAGVTPTSSVALTNKTISGASNTISALAASVLTSGSVAAARGGLAADASAFTGALQMASGVTSALAPGASGNVMTSNGTAWTSAAPSSSVNPSTNSMRLTLETGVAVSSSDQTAKTTLYLTPYFGGQIALYISSVWTLKTTAEVSVALGTLTSGKNYDVFAYWTGSAVAIELLAWTNDTTRATALTTQDGVYVKTGATDRRYVGTIRTTSTTTTEDSAAKRFVYNGPEPWRQVPRFLVSPADTTDSWTYASATWRQARATATNQVEAVVGLATHAQARVLAMQSAGAGAGLAGIGVDSTSTTSAQRNSPTWASGTNMHIEATYAGVLAAGYHYLAWLESTHNGSSATFYGDNAQAAQNGLAAMVPG